MADSLRNAASKAEQKNDTAAKSDTTTRNIQITIDDPADDSIVLGGDDEEPLPAAPADAFLDESAVSEGGLLANEAQQRRVTEAIVKTEVNQGIADARDIMRKNPDQAIIDLKSLVESIRQVPDLDASVRSQLLNRLETSIRQGGQEKLEKDKRDELQREQLANSRERTRQLDLAKRKDEILESYVEQFNSRLDERRYPEAVDLGDRIRDEKPNAPIASAFEKGRAVASYERMVSLRRQRQQAVLDTLYQVEVSFVPFPDEPPLVYPDAEKWIDLTNRRKKYAQIDFADTGTTQQKILDALNENTRVEFFDTPLADAVDYLETLHGVNIEIDKTALDELAIGTDTVVADRTLSGISLKSALKLILGDLGMTYVVEDGYLQITTPDKAAGKLVTKVYPVADLVLPIQTMGGGMMGGMMGGMGGGMMGGGMGGGMMGGMGGGMMGGGMGGGMMGGGMGGGMFDVEDTISLKGSRPIAPKDVAKKKTSKPAKTIAAKNWDAYFRQADDKIVEAEVRETLRNLMRAGDTAQTVEVLTAAVRQGYVRPWTYESLGLAMRANNSPIEEIERAIMSAVDLSSTAEDMMLAAMYMSRMGLEQRALKVYQEVAEAFPLRHEPYMHGLKLAQRMKDNDGIMWACTNILKHEWPAGQRDIQKQARQQAQATMAALYESDSTKAHEFKKNLLESLVRDCRVVVSWTGDADFDVIVEEPTGTVCSIHNARTRGGGVLLGDSYSNPDSTKAAEGASETYVCPKGFAGEYRVVLRRVWGKATGGKVKVDVYVNQGTEQEQHLADHVAVDDMDGMVVFKLPQGRRTESLTEQQVATVASVQVAKNRAILGQQLSSMYNSEAVANLAIARARAGGGRFPFRGGAVGYRPDITLLPEGANLIAATAVISADRRYVRFSGLPFFSGIGEVRSFNFVAGEEGPGGAPGGGAGAFGGGGAGGVF